MANMKFSISFDLGSKLDMLKMVNKEVFPLLNQAVRAVTAQTAYNWTEAVYGAKLWSGEKDAYVKSISWKMTGDFTGEVQATYKHAEEIENGRPARDLKKMLNTSLKVRVNKNGTRYLYIPFRHNTPGNDALANSMPPSVYSVAKNLEASMVTGQKLRVSGQVSSAHRERWEKVAASKNSRGSMSSSSKFLVPQNVYKWGQRLPAGMSQKLQPHHATDPHAGMVRFDTSTPGGAKSSTYLTFRTMSAKSKGWIVPPKDGLKIAEKVVNDMRPKANLAFQQAIKKTLSK